MDYYDKRPGWRGNLFPWVAGLGICVASAGVGMAFTWLLSPPETVRQESGPAELPQADLAIGNSERDINSELDSKIEVDDDPLGIPLEELPLIPVGPSVTSQVRPSRILGRDRDRADNLSALAVNPAMRPESDFLNRWESEREASNRELFDRESSDSGRFSRESSVRELSTNPSPELSNSRDEDLDVDLAANEDPTATPEADTTEQVESRNVAVATPSNPRLDLGPNLGAGNFLVLMAYEGDNSLSRARELSRGAFVKQLDGKTYVQLAAFDQLEYARHMADNLRKQGVSVLILQ